MSVIRKLDSQQVELIGRSLLVGMLLRDGLEVALPERDRGIDVIAYIDRPVGGGPFVACPIQMKSYSGAGFSIESKYQPFPNLILAHLWHVTEPTVLECYALTYTESRDVADQMGWTATASWKSGAYSTTAPSRRLRSFLEPHRITPGRWLSKIYESAGIALANDAPATQ